MERSAAGHGARRGIGGRTTELLEAAGHGHTLPLVVAEAMASDRLGHTVTIPD